MSPGTGRSDTAHLGQTLVDSCPTGRDFSREVLQEDPNCPALFGVENVDRSQGKAGKFKEKKGSSVTHKVKGRAPRARTKARVSLSNHSNLCNTSSTTSLSSKVIVASVEHEGHKRADCYSGKEDAKLHQSLTSQRVAHPQAFQSELALWQRWIVTKQR